VLYRSFLIVIFFTIFTIVSDEACWEIGSHLAKLIDAGFGDFAGMIIMTAMLTGLFGSFSFSFFFATEPPSPQLPSSLKLRCDRIESQRTQRIFYIGRDDYGNAQGYTDCCT
jgi:hypothetical protein